jgi:hypothetical protein
MGHTQETAPRHAPGNAANTRGYGPQMLDTHRNTHQRKQQDTHQRRQQTREDAGPQRQALVPPGEGQGGNADVINSQEVMDGCWKLLLICVALQALADSAHLAYWASITSPCILQPLSICTCTRTSSINTQTMKYSFNARTEVSAVVRSYFQSFPSGDSSS